MNELKFGIFFFEIVAFVAVVVNLLNGENFPKEISEISFLSGVLVVACYVLFGGMLFWLFNEMTYGESIFLKFGGIVFMTILTLIGTVVVFYSPFYFNHIPPESINQPTPVDTNLIFMWKLIKNLVIDELIIVVIGGFLCLGLGD